MITAIEFDSCNVVGYTAWSLMDNFEWNMGFIEKFGIYHVDFDDVTRPRTAKESARYYAQIVADNGFIEPGSHDAAADVIAARCLVIASVVIALFLI